MEADADRREHELARVLTEEYPQQAAHLIEEEATPEEAATWLDAMRPRTALAVFSALGTESAALLALHVAEPTARALLSELNPSRGAALLSRLDPESRDRLLGLLTPALARELRAIAEYPPETAGARMDPRVTSFPLETSAEQAMRALRGKGDARIQDVFLVDGEGRLTGAVSLQQIVFSDPEQRLDGVARTPVSVQAIDSLEQVIDTFRAHRVGSLPVVDFDGHLIGVLRQRELIAAAQAEATADAVLMTGASQQERALSSPLFAVRKRLPWLQINLATAFLAAAVVGAFEDVIAQVTALAVLLPVVAGQSGNTGAQALAVTMRGLALREIRLRHWLAVVIKEVLAGAGNGLAVAFTTCLAVYVWSRSLGLVCVIGVSMVISMTLAGLAGAAIPMILTALRQDPAQSSSILLTTVTDVAGFLSFLGIASLFMRWLQ